VPEFGGAWDFGTCSSKRPTLLIGLSFLFDPDVALGGKRSKDFIFITTALSRIVFSDKAFQTQPFHRPRTKYIQNLDKQFFYLIHFS